MIYLTRIDPTKNERRYYLMVVQETLFGEWLLIRNWGRIGSSGQMRQELYASAAEAEAAAAALQARKQRRGYLRIA